MGFVFFWESFAQLLEEFPLFATQFGRDFNVNIDVHIPSAAALQVRDAQAFQLDLRALLGSLRNLDSLQTIERQDVDFGTQGCLRDIDWNRAVEVVLEAVENRMFFDLQEDVKVAGRTTIHTRLSFSG